MEKWDRRSKIETITPIYGHLVWLIEVEEMELELQDYIESIKIEETKNEQIQLLKRAGLNFRLILLNV